MALPIIDRETHTIELPIEKTTIVLKPYAIAHEKNIAKFHNSKDYKGLFEYLKTVITDCIQGDRDYDSIKYFIDIIYILHKLKVISKSAEQDIEHQCPYCETKNQVKLNIEKNLNIKNKDSKNSVEVMLTKDISMNLKPLGKEYFDNMIKMELSEENTDDMPIVEFISMIIKYMVDIIIDKKEDKIYKKTDFTMEELDNNIINNLTDKKLFEINDNVVDFTHLTMGLEYKCKNAECQKEVKVELQDVLNFLF